MVPKSSDGEAKDGSSSETQSTEYMEISTGDESSMLGKRKVETPILEDLSENEGDIEGVDDDSDSEWDKDSFDGLEYHSCDDQKEYIDKYFEKRARFYKRTVIETKSLDDDLEEGLTVRQFLANMTSLCLDKYNKRKGFNVKLEHVLRANFNPGGRTTYYITFAARESDSPDAPLVEYQVKVDWSAGNTYPILCRPTSPPQLVEGQSQFSLPEKTPQHFSVQTKAKINSSCPEITWNTFSAQLPTTTKKNQPKRSSHEGVIQFSNGMIPNELGLDLRAVIGGFRPNQKALRYKVNFRTLLTHQRSFSNWSQVNTDFGLEDINFLNQMMLSLPYLEADGFNYLQTKLWRPGEFLLQLETPKITSSFILSPWIKWIQSFLIIHQELPYLLIWCELRELLED
ncbi:unnamed protein product [Arabidopsis lyrata]|nr:unnamed protein product [Arabidopsis lyrata]